MDLSVTVIIGTFGAQHWKTLAERALLSVPEHVPAIHVHAGTLAQARNVGAAEADTEWLCFLDADDELAPGYFDAMATADGDLRGPAVQYIRNGREHPPKLWPLVDLRDGNHLVIGTLVRRDMFHDAKGFGDEPVFEDWSLWQRCWRLGADIAQVPDAVYRAHVRSQSRNRAPTQAFKQRWHDRIRRANFPELYQAAA